MVSDPLDHAAGLLESTERVLDRVDAVGQIVQSTPAKTAGAKWHFGVQRTADHPAVIFQNGPEITGGRIWKLENNAVYEDRGSKFG